MEPNAIPPAAGMHLRRLRDLTDFEVADGNPDVRGWDVRGNDGEKFGEVYELIVEPEAMKVRYLEVELDASFNVNERDRHILLPIGAAALDDEADNVFVPSLTKEAVVNYPPYADIYISREYEEAMLRALNLPVPIASSNDFYTGDSYDASRFYTRRPARLGSAQHPSENVS
ncbi:PRC-barrel domain-containing protein [Hymenobacter jejuensis]|uniref:PRC-barrel domain-containing protein n=1 Tax=Hymenobacter jejuensis TaxID=2502781 RepID=A0A5B7ZX34_9BACT|nr:PRC-barrel domain-containing protein [Hymenobacter jejuensis]QDA59721.1 hypothetical protein FHG12_06195 [Hymenobacter jejuensis]